MYIKRRKCNINPMEHLQNSSFLDMPYNLYDERIGIESSYLISSALAGRITKAIAGISLISALIIIGLGV